MRLWLVVVAAATAAAAAAHTLAAASAVRARNGAAGIPLPSAPQLSALQHNFVVFMHYSMCTYTGCQWNLAASPAQDFAPPDAGPNATQWALTAKAMGATQICLTVRHVGGFALWPTATTNYSVAASGWREGKGDVVAEFTAALRAVGISPCLYIILGFNVEANHSGVPGPEYLDRQVTALTELLTNYGPIDRLWWDNYAIGCCQPVTHEGLYCAGGSTTSTPGPSCPGWSVLIDTVRALSPATAIVPGPDGCLVNGESVGGTYPLYHATSRPLSSYSCTDASTPMAGSYFAVVESDFSIENPGDNWFWAKDLPFYNASQIQEQVSVKLEQGANLIFNVPPNASGVVPEAYVQQVAAFGAARAATFNDARAALPAPVAAPCAALSVTLPVTGDFDSVLLREDLAGGQVIGSYSLEVQDAGGGGAWRALPAGAHGRTIGLRLLQPVGLQRNVTALRVNCSSDLAPPPSGAASEVEYVNAAGQCMAAAAASAAAWPCYTGAAAPGGPAYSLCPLQAAACGSDGAAWSEGTPDAAAAGAAGAAAGAAAAGASLVAARLAPDAVVNVDCNSCAQGTHAKVIADGNCHCASGLAFSAADGAIHALACPGMCLSNGTQPGAVASCAGAEPWSAAQVHLVPCGQASGSAGWQQRALPPAPPIATLAFVGAYLQRSP